MIYWLIGSVIAFIMLYFASWFEDVKFMNRPFNKKNALIFASLLCLGSIVTIAAIVATSVLIGSILILMKITK